MGDTQSALRVPSLLQPDRLTCFYGSLGGISMALHGPNVDVAAVARRAYREGLMANDGANTDRDMYNSQTEFARRELGLPIKLIEPSTKNETASMRAVTHGLRAGNHVVFGFTSHHWVALDGFRRFGLGAEDVSWAGMNPANGLRIEEQQANGRLSPAHMLDRLIKAGLPVVIVGEELPPRFVGRDASEAVPPPRFKRAETRPPSADRFRPAS